MIQRPPRFHRVHASRSRTSLTLAACLLGSGIACSTSPSHAVPAMADVENCAPAFRVVGLQDVTASGIANITPIATRTQLDPLIDHVIKCGGEVGWGLIAAVSDKALLRFYVAEPASPPPAPVLSGPSFTVARRKRQYAAAVDAYRAAQAERVQKAEESAAEFRARLDTLLATPPNARRTDVWRAIARAAQFMNEPVQSMGGDAPHALPQYAIVVGDMNDNQHAPRIDHLPGELLIVNGTPIITSDIEALHPQMFESVPAAIRHITAVR